jgi:NAD(P)-dependent dehydrogenase (short-subunit alcohol dehydrogenase family)
MNKPEAESGQERTLAGLSALVVGGGGGIGRVAAAALARDGASVVLMGRTAATLATAALEVRRQARYGAEIAYSIGDATRADDIEAAVIRAERMPGRFSICVTTVGGSKVAPLLLLDENGLRDAIDSNLVSTFLAVKYSAVAMVRGGGGSIVCVSSTAAKLSWPYLASYCIAKAGVEALVRVAADELGRHGIRVNAVRPGLTRTARNAALFEGEIYRRFIEQKALGRTGFPEDIAAGIRYLAGPDSSWVTGQSLAIDGGQELRRATDLESSARSSWGEAAVDAALAGRLPGR